MSNKNYDVYEKRDLVKSKLTKLLRKMDEVWISEGGIMDGGSYPTKIRRQLKKVDTVLQKLEKEIESLIEVSF